MSQVLLSALRAEETAGAWPLASERWSELGLPQGSVTAGGHSPSRTRLLVQALRPPSAQSPFLPAGKVLLSQPATGPGAQSPRRPDLLSSTGTCPLFSQGQGPCGFCMQAGSCGLLWVP